jgi:hypothetical protein
MLDRQQGKFQRGTPAQQKTAALGSAEARKQALQMGEKAEAKPPKVDTPIKVEPKKETGKVAPAKVKEAPKTTTKKKGTKPTKVDTPVNVGPKKTAKKKKRGSKV